MLPALFATAVFVSAALLFLVEPMFARMVLPLLGGAPAVWNTCVVFYQSALFGGYLYAHLIGQRLGLRTQALVHLAVLAGAAAVLPFAIESTPPAAANPSWWVFRLLLTTVGLPFLALSATGPLLQRWFSAPGSAPNSAPNSAASRDPYWLYAASNLGSLLALLAYPFAIEPLLGLRDQRLVWAWAYGGFVLLAGLCVLTIWRTPAGPVDVATGSSPARVGNVAPGFSPANHESSEDLWAARLRWLGLSMIPSTLMLSVTTFMSTDIASVPLLWIAPLSVYLVTLVIAFADRQFIPAVLLDLAFPLAVIGVVALILAENALPARFAVPGHMACFGVIALACHVRLAAERPVVSRLTEFYLWAAAGGAIGGIFNSLVAPSLFVTPLEYPLAAIAACLLFPGTIGWPAALRQRIGAVLATALPAILLVSLTVVVRRGQPWLPDSTMLRYALTGVPTLLACFLLRRAPVRMGVGLALVAVLASFLRYDDRITLHVERTFFGVHRVTYNGSERVLMSGTTNHGSQSVKPALKCEPLSYYSRGGPIGQLFASLAPARRAHVGVVGLGTATMAAYAQGGESWTFFEINPAIERLARNTSFFTYLRDCVSSPRIVLGDARLSIAREPEGAFDVLVVDAFSSDAIPVHLMTQEALDLYLSRLAPHGVVAFHISNRYLDLAPVVAALARSVGGVATMGWHVPSEEQLSLSRGISVSRWAVVARAADDLGGLANDPRWTPITDLEGPLWTDDYSNVVGAFR